METDLIKIFERLKRLLKQYENPLVSKSDLDGRYDLWSIKNIVVDGRKRKEVYFAGLIVQKTYVGFYYMPVYTDTELKGVIKQELIGLLKGKSCFHIKKLDDKLEKQIDQALKKGYRLYEKRGWI